MNFISEFIEVLEKRRDEFEPLLSGGREPSEIEISLGNHLKHHWHENPPSETIYEREFSVDSSSASRTARATNDNLFRLGKYIRALVK